MYARLLQTENKNRRVLAITQWYRDATGWSHWKQLRAPINGEAELLARKKIEISLHRSGTLMLYRNCVSNALLSEIQWEIQQNVSKFKNYPSQVGREPRVNLLIHWSVHDVPVENERLPSYTYDRVTMKATSFHDFPKLKMLNEQMCAKFDCDFDIGLNLVIYRDGSDSIGPHTDDNQNVSLIATVIIQQDGCPWLLKVRPKQKKGKKIVHCIGDEEIILNLRPGDIYVMDGIMQKMYSHEIPKVRKEFGKNGTRRVVAVFWEGECISSKTDTGIPSGLAPPVLSPVTIGHMPGLKEGQKFPSLREIISKKFHRYVNIGWY